MFLSNRNKSGLLQTCGSHAFEAHIFNDHISTMITLDFFPIGNSGGTMLIPSWSRNQP